MSVEQVTETYHSAYQFDSQNDKAREAYAEIAAAIVADLHPRLVFDVGCGGGAFIRGLLQQGVEAFGVDGSSHAASFLPERIEVMDLGQPIPARVPLPDMVTCFDVAEHLDERFADQLVRTCCRNTRLWVLFGAARDGQDGLGHVNCQHPTYWIEKFEDEAFKLDVRISNGLRQLIKEKPHANHLWWVAQNLLVFYKCGQRS
jgi:SAM-dependent methyltransferase